MLSRRRFLGGLMASSVAPLLGGCGVGIGSYPEKVWGVHGTKPGWLHKPRVGAFDAEDQLYIADLTDRIQVFDRDGTFLRHWRTPDLNVDGPSGLTYYPGVGLSDRYAGHFFLCDFRGTPNNSGVRSFAVKPKGAGFEVVDSHEFVWSILATDADFAPDGRFVISDWVNGWNGEGKGRLYAFADPEHAKAGAESAKLLVQLDSPAPGIAARKRSG